MCFTVIAWVYRPEMSLLILPAAIIAQYAVSCVYHWLPYNKTRQAIDHLTIAALILATYAQYWVRSLPTNEASWRILLLGAATVAVLALRLALPNYENLRNALYLVLGFGGLGMSLLNPAMFPLVAWAGFLSGIGLYFVQFLVLLFQKPNPLPELLGFRELQHVILIAASGLHLAVAAAYL